MSMTRTRVVNGAKLRELRELRGLSLRALAARLASDGNTADATVGSYAYLSKIELGASQPTNIFIGRLANVLGVDPDAFSAREQAQDAA